MPKPRLQMVKACLLGNRVACKALSLTLFGAAHFTFADADGDANHPNKLPFKGVLLLLDQPSTKPPHGSRGHRILVPRKAAEENLKTLIGMGVNYDPGNLDEHMPRHKVGTITEAWIAGNKVWVRGFVFKKDFPEAEKQLKGRSDLGMSMELANVYVRDENADVWYLQGFDFTGATILKKDAAAYFNTSLAARAAATGEGAAQMKKVLKRKVAVAAASDSGSLDEGRLATLIASAVQTGVKKAMAPIAEQNAAIVDKLDEIGSLVIQGAGDDVEDAEEVEEVVAGADEEEEDIEAGADEDEEDDDVHAAKDKGSKDPSDEEDDGENDDDEDDMDAMEDLEEKAPHAEPGEVNKTMKTKGRKTTTTDVGAEALTHGKPLGGLKSMAAAAARINQLSAATRRLNKQRQIDAAAHKKEMRKMKNKLERMATQLEAAAENTNRRSVIAADLVNLAAKSNIDLHEIQASGSKLTVAQVDSMIAAFGADVEPHQRMAWKNRLLEQGLMEEGRVERYTM